MDAYPELTAKVRTALEAGESASMETLQALYRECFNEGCRRRLRIVHKLTRFVQQRSAEGVPASSAVPQPATIMGKSPSFRFKAAFKDKKAIVHTPETRYVTAASLTDEDVQLLRDSGYGHFIEEVPKSEDSDPKKAAKKDDKPAQ